MDSTPAVFPWKHQIYLVIDPAAGGPQSDFALVSFYKYKGIITVSLSSLLLSRPTEAGEILIFGLNFNL